MIRIAFIFGTFQGWRLRQARSWIWIAGLLYGHAATLYAQSPAAKAETRDQLAFDPDKGLFSLDISVTSVDGKPIPGLGPKDFTLLDNGKPTRIHSLQSFDMDSPSLNKTSPPAELILVLDGINLNPEQFEWAKREAEKFLRQNGGHLVLPTSVYQVSRSYLLLTAQPSTDGNALANDVAHDHSVNVISWVQKDPNLKRLLEASDRDPLLLHLLSLNALGGIAISERQMPGRKLLVWVGKDWPLLKIGGRQSPKNSFDEVVNLSTRLREARISLYRVIAWPTPELTTSSEELRKPVKSHDDVSIGSLSLETLVAQSGGLLLNSKLGPKSDSNTDSPDSVAGAIDRCLTDARSFYTISFDPPRTDQVDEYHSLQLQINQPGLSVRTRSGYYDEPIYYDQPNPSVKPVSVKELEMFLAQVSSTPTASGISDSALALQLSSMALSERVSSERLSSWENHLPGPKSWSALVELSDESTFLNPPADEIPDTPPPDQAERRAMLSRTVDYLGKTIPRLPNFTANRTTIRYEEPQTKVNPEWKRSADDRPLQRATTTSESVLYRNGSEVTEDQRVKKEDRSLTTRGTFGPILSTVILDASHGSLTWSHWQKTGSGPQAVFRYSVPSGKSHYQVSHCCLAEGDGTRQFLLTTGYHGTLTINPVTGAILRLTVEADLEPTLPLIQSDILVEYGPVAIGSATYICPLRSISISRGRTVKETQMWGVNLAIYGGFESVMGDVTFNGYHMFGSDSRLLTGFEPIREPK